MIQLGCLQRDGIDVWVLLRDFQLQASTGHELKYANIIPEHAKNLSCAFNVNLKVFPSNSDLQIMSLLNANVELALPWRSGPVAFLVSSELWRSGPSFQKP